MKNWFDWIGSAGEREEKDPKRTSVLYRQACIFVCEGVVGVFKATFKNTPTENHLNSFFPLDIFCPDKKGLQRSNQFIIEMLFAFG